MVLIKVLSYQKRTFLFFTKIFDLLVKMSRSWVYLRRDASFFFGILVKSVWFGLFCNVVSKFSMWGRLHPKVPRREPCKAIFWLFKTEHLKLKIFWTSSNSWGKKVILKVFVLFRVYFTQFCVIEFCFASCTVQYHSQIVFWAWIPKILGRTQK